MKQNKLTNKTKLTDPEDRLLVARGEGGWGMGKTGEGDQEEQVSSYKVSKSLWCNVHHGDYSQ